MRPKNTFSILALCNRQSDGAIVTPSMISSTQYSVWDKNTLSVIADDVGLTTSSVFFSTLQTDSRFPSGYNFNWPVPASLVPPQGSTYVYQIIVTLSDSSSFTIDWEQYTQNTGAPT